MGPLRGMVRVVAVVTLAALLLAGPVGAQERELTPEETQRVEALAYEAKAHRDAGRFPEAIAKLKAAIRLHSAPWLLYNLARTYEDAGDDILAKAHYELCLSRGASDAVKERAEEGLQRVTRRLARGWLKPDVQPAGCAVIVDGELKGLTPMAPVALRPGPHRVRIEKERYLTLEQQVDIEADKESALTVQMVPVFEPPAPEPEGEDSGISPWQWVTLGTGAGLTVIGGVVLHLGNEDYRTVKNADGYGDGGYVDLSGERARSLVDDGETKQIAGAALLGVGGALLVTSAVLFLVDAVDGEDEGTISAAKPSVWSVPDGSPMGGTVFGFQGGF